MKKIILVISLCSVVACAHGNAVGQKGAPQNIRETLGYLQFKAPYAEAAWNEGRMAGVKLALDNRHSRTGKPYPCWNALKPFHGKNLPVSLKLNDSNDPKLQAIVRLGQLPTDKLDSLGKDGTFIASMPVGKGGYAVWKIDQVNQKVARTLDKPVIGLVDISESMKASAKLRTLMGLKDSNIRFQKIFLFSGPESLSEVTLGDIARQTPKGNTAIYDNLKNLLSQYPGSEFVIITDGKDNKSKTSLEDVEGITVQSGSVVNIVLTGKRTNEKIATLAHKSGGRVMQDTYETGEVMQPALDISFVR